MLLILKNKIYVSIVLGVWEQNFSIYNKGRNNIFKFQLIWDFPDGPVVKTSPSSAGGAGSIPGRGAKIPHAWWPKNQNIFAIL